MQRTIEHQQCREIITRAVCGKGRKFSQRTHTVHSVKPLSAILGCWVINHNFHAEKVNSAVELSGSCDIQVWAALKNNTDTVVIKEKVSFVETIPLSFFDENCRGSIETFAEALRPPTCTEAKISDSTSVQVSIESEYAVEIIGETKLCILICSDYGGEEKDVDMEAFRDEDEFEDFDSIIDDLD